MSVVAFTELPRWKYKFEGTADDKIVVGLSRVRRGFRRYPAKKEWPRLESLLVLTGFTGLTRDWAVDGDWVTLERSRLPGGAILTVRLGYNWDGPSGPTIDTPNWMRGSLAHDAVYQLLRDTDFGQEEPYCPGLPRRLQGDGRACADMLMYQVLRDDRMSRVRARTAYFGVRAFGASAARRRSPAPLQLAG